MKKLPNTITLVVIIGLLLIAAFSYSRIYGQYSISEYLDIGDNINVIPSPVEQIPENELTTPDLVLLGAREEAKNKTIYDASYQNISYPGGDVDPKKGACTDVVIRAFRKAGIDLQQAIHEDMRANFDAYPANWGLTLPDPNIDHRRIPNQVCFFKRHGKSLSLDPVNNPEDWHWGDIVYWKFPNGDEHCGIVSDRTNKRGIPLVIHNAGICREEDALLRWEITGHYRYN